MADVKYTAFRENVNIESPLSTGQFASKVVAGNTDPRKKNDHLNFTSLKYPLDVGSNELGHFIVLYMLSNNTGNVNNDRNFAASVGLNRGTTYDSGSGKTIVKDIKSQNEGTLQTTEVDRGNSIFSKVPTHSITTGAITLYMPSDVSVSYKQNYDNEASGIIGETLATFRKENSTFDKLKEAAFGATASIAQKGFSLISQGLSNIEGLGDAFQVTSKALGVAVNPQQEQFYNSPDFRSFTYQFDFHPRSEAEMLEVHNILWLLKYHMAPSLEGGAGFSGRFFRVPSEFEIFYYYKGLQNDFLNKISRCVLSDLSIKYGPSGQWSTFDWTTSNDSNRLAGAPPVSISASLTFLESMFLTKQQIEKGY